MKKTVCLIVAIISAFSISAFSEDIEEVTISYDNVGDYVKQANPDIEQLKINIYGMERTLRFLQSTYTAEQNIARENIKESLEYTRYNLDAVRELLVYNAQLMISGYYQLNMQIEQIDDSLEALKSKNRVLQVMYDIGYTSYFQLDSMRLNIKNLENTKTTLERQRDLLVKQLNRLMGRDPELILNITDFKAVEAQSSSGGPLAESDFDKEYKIAYDRNFSLKVEQEKYAALEKKDQFSPETRAQRIALNKARTDFKANFRAAFDDVFYNYAQIELYRSLYEGKKSEYNLTEIKYEVGVVSKNDLIDAQNALKTEKQKIANAEVNYMNAYLKYKAFLNGANPVSQ